MYTSKQILPNSCNGGANVLIANRFANIKLKKFGKDIKRFAPRGPHPKIVFPPRSNCNYLDVHGTDVNAQMPRSAHFCAFHAI
jgi:hypothetical protein